MKETYIFDLDGTLIDSMQPAVKIVLDFLTEYGIPYSDDLVQRLTPLGFKGIARCYAEELGVPLSPAEIYARFTERLTYAYAHDIPLKPYVRTALERLRASGARLNVLTASPHAFTDVCLKNCGVYDLFENVWSAEEDFGFLKSDERLFVAAPERLSRRACDCVMADDSLRVLRVAKAAGMRTIGVYDVFSAKDEAEMRALADAYIKDFSELTFIRN